MKTMYRYAAACAAALSMLHTPVASAQETPPAEPFYQALGGKPGIEKIVAIFLPIVLADGRIKQAFKDTDAGKLAALLEEHFCELSGGPCEYSGKNMKAAHEEMHITNAQFNALAEDLQSAMEQQGVPSRVQNRLMAKLAPMQRDIVRK